MRLADADNPGGQGSLVLHREIEAGSEALDRRLRTVCAKSPSASAARVASAAPAVASRMAGKVTRGSPRHGLIGFSPPMRLCRSCWRWRRRFAAAGGATSTATPRQGLVLLRSRGGRPLRDRTGEGYNRGGGCVVLGVRGRVVAAGVQDPARLSLCPAVAGGRRLENRTREQFNRPLLAHPRQKPSEHTRATYQSGRPPAQSRTGETLHAHGECFASAGGSIAGTFIDTRI